MYVSNLSYNTGETELTELFSSFGEVSSVKIIKDRETGRSRGFGFVEMMSNADAQAAMSALNNKVIEGRSLNVSEARERAEGNRGGFRSNNSSNRRW